MGKSKRSKRCLFRNIVLIINCTCLINCHLNIAVYGHAGVAANHPDSRAIFYEDFSKKKIETFLSLLRGFRESLQVTALFQEADLESDYLNQLTSSSEKCQDGNFPDLQPILDYFNSAFDPEQALTTGKLLPRPGMNPDYDAFGDRFKEMEKELQANLNDMRKTFGCEVKYIGSDKKRYQIEVPERNASKAGSSFELTSSRKGFKRFYTPKAKVPSRFSLGTIKVAALLLDSSQPVMKQLNQFKSRTIEGQNSHQVWLINATQGARALTKLAGIEFTGLLAKMMQAEEEKKAHLADMNRTVFAHFAADMDKWLAATRCLAVLDVLVSLAIYGREENTCIPEIEDLSEGVSPFIEIEDGRLPTTTLTEFIPNDTVLGADTAQVLILTGPNMGGKSTLMRQLGLLVIMAQIGSPVPAAKCRLTPVDRIFTRIGARDNMPAGESTFMVEMSETATIMNHATPQSLALIDELGRGTATFDGAALAYSVLKHIVCTMGTLAVFSTHYHFLMEVINTNPEFTEYSKRTALMHMACMEEEDESGILNNVTFLYKLSPGACPSSHGFNTARLAGISDKIVINAKTQARKLQSYPEMVNIFQRIMKSENIDEEAIHHLDSRIKNIELAQC